MPWLAALAAVGGGAMGAASSAADRNAAENAQGAAVQQWLSLHVPDPALQQLYLQQYKQTGQLSPELERAMSQGPSSFNKIQVDPKLRQAQLSALQQLQNEGDLGGLSLQDAATQQEQMIQANAAAKGRNDAIMNRYQEQGLGGSGLELQAQLQNAQNANQNQALTSLQSAANARQRALQAVHGAGQLGGQMESQQYGEAANAARAQDLIDQFNTQNAQNVANRNVANRNSAQQYNLGLQQQVADANVGLRNQQEAYNKGLIQQNFENQSKKASGAANAQIGQANFLGNQAQGTANMWAGIGSGIGKGISAYQQYKNQGNTGGGNDMSYQSGGTGQGQYAGNDDELWGNSYA